MTYTRQRRAKERLPLLGAATEAEQLAARQMHQEAATHAVAHLIVRYFADGWDEARRMVRDGEDLDSYSLGDILDAAARRYFQAQQDAERVARFIDQAGDMRMPELGDTLARLAADQRQAERAQAQSGGPPTES